MTDEKDNRYHRTGEPGGPACPVGVLPIMFGDGKGGLQEGALLDAGANASEIELLRTIVSRMGVTWGHDQFGWWAAVPNPQFPSWSVWRQDDNGNKFCIHFNMAEAQAKGIVAHYEGLGHKQCYWAQDDKITQSQD